MFANVWNNVVQWFKDRSDRNLLIRSFNQASREVFISGVVPTLLKSSISSGDKSFRHHLSNWLHSGFRVQASSGRQLSKDEIIQIGTVIVSDSVLMRRLFVLGFDTLEVCGDVGTYGCKWQIKDCMQLEG